MEPMASSRMRVHICRATSCIQLHEVERQVPLYLFCAQPPVQQASALPSTAAAAPGLPASVAAPGLQTVPELSRLQQPGQEAKEDVFAKSTPEELMLGGHEEGEAGHRPPRSSSLTEALASEAVKAADSAAPAQQVLPPKVSALCV